MRGFNRSGLHGDGPMLGRRLGHCHLNQESKTDDQIRRTDVDLVSILIIGAAKLVWLWIREKRMKKSLE